MSGIGPSTLEPMVRKLAQRTHLEAADRAAILGLPFTLKTLDRGGVIVREHQPATYTCVMLSGFSMRTKDAVSGARQILAIHMKGDIVDLQNSLLQVADHGVEMLTMSKLALIPREEILRLAFARPAVGQAMWMDSLIDASIFREWIANVGIRDARARVAHLFCEFAARMKAAGLAHGDDYELPMSQEQLGQATGLTSVHINRTIRLLEAEGLIERATARAIHIGDFRRIAEVGGFDSTYLHLPEQQKTLMVGQTLSA